MSDQPRTLTELAQRLQPMFDRLVRAGRLAAAVELIDVYAAEAGQLLGQEDEPPTKAIMRVVREEPAETVEATA